MTYQTLAKLPAASAAPRRGWVYFMMEAERGHYKIGSAVDVEARLKTLQTGCAEELHIAGVMPSDQPLALERKMHKRFAKHHLRGEWFRYSEEISYFLECHAYELGGRVRIWECLNDGEPPALVL